MSLCSVSASASTLKTRAREAGSFAVVLAFVGTLALAPFSIASAQATAAAQPEPAAVAQMPHGQRLVAADADEQVTSLESMSVTPAPAVQTAEGSSAEAEAEDSAALYTLQQFMFSGVVNWGGYKYTFYSQQVLPGGGLQIPGRHVSDGGYVTDADGFIVLAGSAPKGTVYATPFGAPGKIYDRGTVGNHLDVYIR